MSYILDALKKSEKKRRQGTVPDVLTVQETVYHEPRKRRLWAYVIVIALVLNTAALVWFVPSKSRKPNPVVQSNAETSFALKEQKSSSGDPSKPDSAGAIAAREDEANTQKSAVDRKLMNKSNIMQHQPSATKGDEQKKIAQVQKPVIAAQVTPHVPPVVSPQTPAASVPAEPKHLGEATPIPDKIYSLSELPLSIQQKLPSFGISVFLYSDDPSSRMVKINNQMMREGQYLSEGLKLEEINQNGMIFTYQNFHFRVGLK